MSRAPGPSQVEIQTAAAEPLPDADELTAEALASRAEGVGERDEAVRQMVLIDPELPPERQLMAMEVYKGYLINIVAKLKAAGVQVDILMKKPELLPYMVRTKALELTPDEATALTAYEQLMKARGVTVDYFKKSALWAEILGEGESLFKNPKGKWMEWYEASPKLTMAVSAGVAILGTGLLVKGLKALFSSDSKEKAAAEKKFFTKGKIAGLGVAGLFAAVLFGREYLIDWAKDVAKGKTLKSLKKNVENTVSSPSREVSNEVLEHPDGSKIVCIGDSMMRGMCGRPEWQKKPDFIGQDGFASYKTLSRLMEPESLQKLKGKEKALIYTGGNNVGDSSPQKIVQDTIEMVKICKEAGIKDIRICTRFPIDPRRQEKPLSDKDTMRLGPEKYAKRMEDSKALRSELMRAYVAGEFPSGTRLIDLFPYFDNGRGEMKPEYAEKAKRTMPDDFYHPRPAYVAALNHILSEDSKDTAVS